MAKRSLIRKFAKFLPKKISHWLIRSQLRVDESQISPNLMIKIAESKEELEQAYEILYQTYLEYGYQTPNESGMRVIKYFALPTTTTIVAKVENKVVGTMTIIRKTGLGLPLEKEFDYQNQMNPGETVAEVSSLAISKDFRHKRGTIFLPLCSYIYNYLVHYMEIDNAVIAVNPSWASFYEGILCFKLLKKKIISNYQFANGAPAVGLITQIKSWDKNLENAYKFFPKEKSIHQYFNEVDKPYYHWPNRDIVKSMDPVMDLEMLNYFFCEKSDVFKTITPDEMTIINAFYIDTAIKHIFKSAQANESRKTGRYPLNTIGIINGNQLVSIQEVSLKGLKIHGLGLIINQTYQIKVKISKRAFSNIFAEVAWINSNENQIGLKITKSDSAWDNFIVELINDVAKAS